VNLALIKLSMNQTLLIADQYTNQILEFVSVIILKYIEHNCALKIILLFWTFISLNSDLNLYSRLFSFPFVLHT